MMTIASILDSRQKTTITLILLLAITGFSIAIGSVAAFINEYGSGGTIKPQSQWYEALDYVESTNQPVQSQQFFVQTNASADLYLLNSTQFANYLTNKTLPANPTIQGINGIFSEDWNVTYLHQHYDLPVINETGQNSRHVWMVVLLSNPSTGNVTVQFEVRLGYTLLKKVIYDMAIFAKFLDMACFGIVSFKLLWATRKLKKSEGESKRAEIVRGMGIAYLCVFGAFFLGELRVYWEGETGGFMPYLFKINYNSTSLPISYFDLFVCFLLMLVSLTFLSLTYTVEKKVKNFRHPFISYVQLVAMCLFPFVFAYPAMFLFAIIFLVVAICIAAVLLVGVYIQVAINSEGLLRKRAIFTLLGLALPLTCFALREFVPNVGDLLRIILDSVTICGLLFFWWGNMKYLEKPPA